MSIKVMKKSKYSMLKKVIKKSREKAQRKSLPKMGIEPSTFQKHGKITSHSTIKHTKNMNKQVQLEHIKDNSLCEICQQK